MSSTAFASADEIAGWLARARGERSKANKEGLLEAERFGLDAVEALNKMGKNARMEQVAEAQLSLGDTQLRLGKHHEALKMLEVAEHSYRGIDKQKPSSGLFDALRLQAKCLFAMGELEAAKPKARFAGMFKGKGDDDADSYFKRAGLCQMESLQIQAGWLDNAMRLFGQVNSRLPEQDRLYHSPHTSAAVPRAQTETKEQALPPVPSEKEIVAALDEHVVGQHAAKAMLAYACREHIRRLHKRPEERTANEGKLNFFVYGPTGCGKTLMLNSLSALLGVPVIIADATNLTASGYRGGDIENIFYQLLVQCNWNVALARRAIVLIDEIDKKAKSDSGPDIGGAKIQHELLPILDGTRLRINKTGNNAVSSSQDTFVELDTGDMLFGVAGAFSGLEEILGRDSAGPAIGFGATLKGDDNVDFSKARPEDFVIFGILPELLGRLPIRCHIRKLNKEELRDALTEPTNSLVEQFRARAVGDFELLFTEEALTAIVSEAFTMGTNARALNAIMHECLRAVKEVPETKAGLRVITAEVVKTREQLLAMSSAAGTRKRRKHSFIASESQGEARGEPANASLLERLGRVVA